MEKRTMPIRALGENESRLPYKVAVQIHDRAAVAESLTQLRLKAKLSRPKWAEILGISVTTIKNYERATREISTRSVLKIAQVAFDKDYDLAIGGLFQYLYTDAIIILHKDQYIFRRNYVEVVAKSLVTAGVK